MKDSQIRVGYITYNESTCLKGIFAIFVLIHHLYQWSGLFRNGYSLYFGYCLQALGYYSVAMFIFLSGYGLMASQSEKTKHTFFKKKVVPYYLVMCVFILAYSIFDKVVGTTITLCDVLKSLTWGGTIIINGWYLQVQLLYYLLFYFVCQFESKKKQMVLMTVLQIVYMSLCILFNQSTLLYERTLLFVLGMVWFEEKDCINSWINKGIHYWTTVLCSMILMIGLYLLTGVTENAIVCGIERGLSYPFFIVLTICSISKVRIVNGVTRFFGKISLEIYVFQGMFLMLFHSSFFYLNSVIVYIISVSICTITMAFLFHPLCGAIYGLFRKRV